MNKEFKALVVEEYEPGKFSKSIRTRTIDSLPEGDVLINVKYSGLNYKDGLSARGHKGITRKYPHTPGVDAAGIVAESVSEKFSTGDEVLVTGYDLGMNTSGGFAGYIRVPAAWVVPLPAGINPRESMIYGTAGFTAGICINELQKHDVMPDSGKVLVTGATGAVGCLAVAMLSRAGYDVTASTGKPDKTDFLMSIGAKEVLSREEVNDKTGRALLPGRWAGAIDTVGGNTLSTVFRSILPRGAVAVLGLVESDKLETNIYPFILRGVMLIGIDSAERPMEYRLNIWRRISSEWKLPNPDILAREVALDNLNEEIDLILQGRQTGKVLVRI